LKRETIKGSGGVFVNRAAGLTIILLTAIVCILGSIDATGYAEAKDQTTSPSAITTEIDGTGELRSNEVEGKARQRRSVPKNSAANNPLDNSKESAAWEIVQMRVTAYCPCPKCCGQYSDGETACGHKIRPRDAFVAADPKYAFGTEMVIAGYGGGEPVKVLDRGGAIRGNRLDVFFHSHEEALKWGVKHLDVKISRK
jgi:3D (Asp-Asp-Asp) domain-containing protein